jgi:ABC-type xylose transport system substrate-binding protein
MSIGNKTIPADLWTPVAVTRDNVKHNTIRDGFQNLKTIQESLPEQKCPK